MRLPTVPVFTLLLTMTLPAQAAPEGRPAILDISLGKGHEVAYNFNPMHRDLKRSDYRLLWNAIINWQAPVRQPIILNEGSRP